MMENEEVIEVRNLRKSFGKVHVLRGIDLTVRRGEICVLMGLSGTGKSVLLKHILGLLTPDGGDLLIDGVDFLHASRAEREPVFQRMAMCFQNAALFDSMSARENVAFPLRENTKLPPDEIEKRVDHALRIVGLSELGNRSPSEISGGMRKRVGLARALVIDPEIILFDEPTTGLDPILSDAIIQTIRKTHEELKYTTLIVTHELKVTFELADHVALLLDGKIAFDGTSKEFSESKDPAVVQFIAGRSEDGPIRVQ